MALLPAADKLEVTNEKPAAELSLSADTPVTGKVLDCRAGTGHGQAGG